MPYKSNKDIAEQFKAEFYFLFHHGYAVHEGEEGENLLSHISQIRKQDLEGLKEWAESRKRKVPPVNTSFEVKSVQEQLKAISDEGYNTALTDFITKVESLNQDTK